MLFDIDINKTLTAGKRVFQLQARFTSEHQRLVILGPSGAGKSLLLQCIAGLVRPDSGHICLAGRTLFDANARINLAPQQRAIAYLFQSYALFPHLSVRQNIAFGLQRGLLNPSPRIRIAEVEHWLDTFGLQQVAEQFPGELSGGQRQRTALARALAAQPEALLLDEPFSALDTTLRQHMRDELDALQRRLQVPMLLITHDPEDAVMFGDETLTLNDGRLTHDQGR